MIEAVGLTRRQLALYPHEFSGGQQRRLGLARILSLNPTLIILDEPTSGLDVSVQATILKLFLELKNRFDLTYIFISHNADFIEQTADKVYGMANGCITLEGEKVPHTHVHAHGYGQHPHIHSEDDQYVPEEEKS